MTHLPTENKAHCTAGFILLSIWENIDHYSLYCRLSSSDASGCRRHEFAGKRNNLIITFTVRLLIYIQLSLLLNGYRHLRNVSFDNKLQLSQLGESLLWNIRPTWPIAFTLFFSTLDTAQNDWSYYYFL